MATRPDLKTVYQAEFTYVWHALRRIGVPAKDLEDVVQEVFMVVHRRLDGYDPTRPIKPWLFGICFRVASDFRRRAYHSREIGEDSPDGPTADASPEDRASATQDREVVMRALSGMDLEKRAVFVMHELNGHAMPEIATALEIPLNTAYSRLRLARGQFAAAVKRLRGAEVQP